MGSAAHVTPCPELAGLARRGNGESVSLRTVRNQSATSHVGAILPKSQIWHVVSWGDSGSQSALLAPLGLETGHVLVLFPFILP